jgi:hypothetical protein
VYLTCYHCLDHPVGDFPGVINGSRQTSVGSRLSPLGDFSRIKNLRSESAALKELVAELTLETAFSKKACLGLPLVRAPPAGKRELTMLNIPSAAYYQWYARWVIRLTLSNT